MKAIIIWTLVAAGVLGVLVAPWWVDLVAAGAFGWCWLRAAR